MSNVRCIIQQDSVADRRRSQLEARLLDHHGVHYPGESFDAVWLPVPSGHMFTEGRQSTSSIVSCFVDHRTTLAERERYMRGVCELWTEVAECTDHEVVVTITETTIEE